MAEIWAAAISALLFLYILKQFITKKKKLPPGPLGLPILGHFHLFGSNPHHDLYHLARKHGPIMYIRLGPVPTVVISSAAAAELIFTTNDQVFANRPHNEASKYINYGQRGIVFARYGHSWRNMRKLVNIELLSQKRISQFHSMRMGEVGDFISSLKEAAKKRETVDVSARVSELTANMTCLMVFGRKYGDEDFDDKGFKSVIMETVEAAGVFNLGDYFPYIGLLDLQGLTRKFKRLSKTFDGFMEKIIDDHVQGRTENKTNAHKDFVDILMALLDSGEAGFEFDRRHVKALLLDLFIAGMDTAATTVEWTLSELLRHPEIMQILKKELEHVVGLEHMVDESHLERLPYLDCVIKESFRLHPAIPIFLHESMKDCEIDELHIPNKSRVMVNVWAIGRDPSSWHEPEKFSPERFIGSNIDLRGCDFQLIPFGAGRRGCPGLQLGLLVVRLAVAQLVHCFDWELPNDMLPNDLDMFEHFGLVTSRANHLMAIPSYRLLT